MVTLDDSTTEPTQHGSLVVMLVLQARIVLSMIGLLRTSGVSLYTLSAMLDPGGHGNTSKRFRLHFRVGYAVNQTVTIMHIAAVVEAARGRARPGLAEALLIHCWILLDNALIWFL